MSHLQVELPADSIRIALRDGPTVSTEAIHLLLELADRNITARLDTTGRLSFSPPSRLGREDWRRIREHEADLVACVRFLEAM